MLAGGAVAVFGGAAGSAGSESLVPMLASDKLKGVREAYACDSDSLGSRGSGGEAEEEGKDGGASEEHGGGFVKDIGLKKRLLTIGTGLVCDDRWDGINDGEERRPMEERCPYIYRPQSPVCHGRASV